MKTQTIWDPIIRIFHWTVALAFLLNYFVLEEGEEPHELAGYYILFALAVRIIWGFVGSQNARFRSFFPTIEGVKKHLSSLLRGEIPAENGHNPVGALMIFALLFGLFATGLSGWLLESTGHEHWLKEVHETAANTTMLLVVIHVAAVVFFTYKGPRNLVRQMVTGRIEEK